MKFHVRAYFVARGLGNYVTITSLGADISSGKETKRITAYFRRGYYMKNTFSEVIEPCYNIAVSLVIREFAAKINRFYYKLQASNADVDELIRDTDEQYDQLSYLNVYELGFSGNLRAVPALVRYTGHDNDLVRLAAISALGTIGAESELDRLRGIYESGPAKERDVAIKAIGDLDSEEARSLMRQIISRANSPRGRAFAESTQEVIDLYQ